MALKTYVVLSNVKGFEKRGELLGPGAEVTVDEHNPKVSPLLACGAIKIKEVEGTLAIAPAVPKTDADTGGEENGEGDGQGEGGEKPVVLEDLTKAGLIEFATARGITLAEGLKKAEMIDAITKALSPTE